MMAEYIDREKVLALSEDFEALIDDGADEIFFEYIPIDKVKTLPAADVRPVRRGKWIDEPIKGIRYHCSVCQGRFDYTWRYCPNCGAKMEES